MKTLINKNKGITLIALVITIIILLILAGVTIATLTKNGLFEKTKLSKEISEYTSAKEIISIKLMETNINKNGNCTIEEVASNIKNTNNITIEKYYNEEIALIKTGVIENLINLKAIVVSVNEYSKYKFLIGEDCRIICALAEEITDITEISEFKDLDAFENELFGRKDGDSSHIDTVTSSKILSYKIKDNDENTTKKYYTQITDLTGNGNNATLYNIDTTEDEKGIIFNGTSSYAKLDFQQELTFPMTIEITLRTQKKQTNSIIYLEPNSLTAFGMYNNHFVFSISTDSNTIQIPDDFFDGNLKHIIITYNSLTDFELYINGEKLQKNSSTDAWTSGIGTIPYLGRREQGNYFDGELFNFRIYNRILEESEIDGTENNSNIILEYNIKNDTSYEIIPDIIKDMANNSNDATVYNSEFNDKKDGIIFNGESTYAELGLKQELTFPMTVEMMIKTSTNSKTEIFYLEPNSGVCFGNWVGDYFICTVNTSTQVIPIPSDFYDGGLKHIIVTYNSFYDFEVYINGEKQEKSTSKDYFNSDGDKTFYLGKRARGNFFEGVFYEFNVYSRVLNENEISLQYEYVKQNYL